LWSKLKSRQLSGYKFRRQYSVDGFVIDFYCPALKFAIEVDGETHDQRIDYDLQRQKKVESLGIRFLRFSNSDIFQNMEAVLDKIIDIINQHTPSISPSGRGSE